MAKPSITNIRPGDPDGNVWNLNDLANDQFFALSGTGAFDDLIEKLNLDGTGLTADDLGEYDYAFFGTNGSDTVTGVIDLSGIIATGNGQDDITSGALDHVIFAGNGTDTVSGGGGDDILFGENGKDLVSGNAGNDEVNGGKGTDTLNGGDGDDTLNGGNGVDVLTGGEGEDVLTGNNGGDEFRWNQTADFGDTVTDFTAGSDKLVFDVGDEDSQISVGNNDTTVDNYQEGDDTAINVADTEVGVKTDAALATINIQGVIDGYDNITTGALFAFLDSTEGHAVLYYDADPSADGGAMLVANLTNITTLDQLAGVSAGDFVFG